MSVCWQLRDEEDASAPHKTRRMIVFLRVKSHVLVSRDEGTDTVQHMVLQSPTINHYTSPTNPSKFPAPKLLCAKILKMCEELLTPNNVVL